MITGSHVVLFSRDAEGVRDFFRDILGFAHVDAGQGWLIFALPPAEAGVHPSDGPNAHELYFTCDDIHATVDELRQKGVEFTGDISDEGFGLMVTMRIPGGAELSLYQPRHPLATAQS